MNLVHHSSEDNIIIEPREYSQEKSYFKPNGFWVSIEDSNYSWEEWCNDEETEFLLGDYKYKVLIEDYSNILIIKSVDHLKQFHNENNKKLYPLSFLPDVINWVDISKTYSGIIIPHYYWSERISIGWYYTWDCASGCIWDTSIIDRVERVK